MSVLLLTIRDKRYYIFGEEISWVWNSGNYEVGLKVYLNNIRNQKF